MKLRINGFGTGADDDGSVSNILINGEEGSVLFSALNRWAEVSKDIRTFSGKGTPEVVKVVANTVTEKLKESPIAIAILQKMDQAAEFLTDIPVTAPVLIATVLANMWEESQLNDTAVAGVKKNLSPKQIEAYQNKAKGLLQLLPSTFAGLVEPSREIEADTIANKLGWEKVIKKMDPALYEVIQDKGHPIWFLANYPWSQFFPSLKLALANIIRINKEWDYDAEAQMWTPTLTPVNPSIVDQMWNLVPDTKRDPEAGFCHLFTVYHINGTGLLRSPSFDLHYTDVDAKGLNRYSRTINIFAQLAVNMKHNTANGNTYSII